MEQKPVSIKYADVGGFKFAELIQRIVNHPTDGSSAYHIKQLTKELEKGRKQIHTEYMVEVREVYAKRTEDGKIDTEGGDPKDENYFQPDETKMDAFMKAQDAFGARNLTLACRAVTPRMLGDMKISAKELDLLGELYSLEEGPGVPHLRNSKG